MALEQAELTQFLSAVIELSKDAGHRILEVYQSNFSVDFKTDNSPLTAADLASHNCLVAGLAKLLPSYPILSEESGTIPFAQRVTWDTFWLIDPLDGTKEFVKRNGEFTVNVALIHRHKPILGVVYAPAQELCYYAAYEQGAFRQIGHATPEEITVQYPAHNPLRVVGSRSHSGAELQDYLRQLGEYQLIVSGSSLKFCRVAEGSADLYPRLAPTSEWDTAAAHAIVQEAGGAVVDLHRKELRYNTKESLLNPYFIAFGDQSRRWVL